MKEWYEIRVRGELDRSWEEWFAEMKIERAGENETMLRGPVQDQTALYSILNKLRNLGVELLDVRSSPPPATP